MKKYACAVVTVLFLQGLCSILCGWRGTAPALTGSELACLDNITSGGADSTSGNEETDRRSPAYDDPWYLSRLQRFPSFYSAPYLAYVYPYADPYTAAFGYPLHYYDDYHNRGWHEHQGPSGSILTDTPENMRERLRDCRKNLQTFMLDRREERRERFENIRENVQDVFSRNRCFDVRYNRMDDFDRQFPGREHRGMGFRARDTGNWVRGSRR